MWKKYAVSLFALTAIPAVAQTPAEAVAQFYPEYSTGQQCPLLNNDQGLYCMREQVRKIVDSATGKQLYLLMRGNTIVPETHEETDGYHAQSGEVGMFVFRQNGADWQLSHAKADIAVGAFGQAPKDWTMHQFGQNVWGFLQETGDMHQGYAGSQYVILLPNGANSIGVYGVPASASNIDVRDCETDENPQACRATQYNLESTIKIRRDLSPDGGVYPLQLTINGYDGAKKYHNTRYIVRFNASQKKYVFPKDYPLSDKAY